MSMRPMAFAVGSSGSGPGPSNTLLIQTSQVDPNLRSMAITGGWDQTSKLFVNITAALINRLTVSQSFPGGIEITIGASTIVSSDGAAAALTASVPVSVRNNGQILASGGRGGDGGTAQAMNRGYNVIGYGGSGGQGAGFAPNSISFSATPSAGQPGTFDQYTGPSFPGETPATAQGGTGGTGGNHAQSGGSGGPGSVSGTYESSSFSPAGFGGPPSNAVTGNSNITWLATGTRTGTIA